MPIFDLTENERAELKQTAQETVAKYYSYASPHSERQSARSALAAKGLLTHAPMPRVSQLSNNEVPDIIVGAFATRGWYKLTSAGRKALEMIAEGTQS